MSDATAILQEREESALQELLDLGFCTSEELNVQKKLVSFEHQGRLLYPSFQLDSQGETLKVVGDVLEALPTNEMSNQEIAFWWISANGWLEGKRPVEVIDDNPNLLVEAAAHLAEPSPF